MVTLLQGREGLKIICEGKFKECKECRVFKYLAVDGGPLYCINPEVLKRLGRT